jgi:hypothetical protein
MAKTDIAGTPPDPAASFENQEVIGQAVAVGAKPRKGERLHGVDLMRTKSGTARCRSSSHLLRVQAVSLPILSRTVEWHARLEEDRI